MLRPIRWVMILVVLGLSGWAAYAPAARYWRERNRVTYLEAEVTRGRIVAVVNSTGTVKPVRSVLVGAFVSGPIESVLVAQIGIWLYARAEGGALGLVDYLAQTFGPLVPLQFAIAALVAWWSTR